MPQHSLPSPNYPSAFPCHFRPAWYILCTEAIVPSLSGSLYLLVVIVLELDVYELVLIAPGLLLIIVFRRNLMRRHLSRISHRSKWRDIVYMQL